ncbi:MAG: type II toxin-antitoxin system Phd/YefM family antitoxin [Erysipelotrichaceae bacterium]|jgi:prevent-host-death family protein|nr:type II toxin-antitoxin system Phd/YefM family antitoxin [Erysipelotrichaceae bacterium]
MCYVTATELKNNLSHYLELSKKEYVYVTKNGEVITVLTNPEKQRLLLIEELAGSLGKVDSNIDYDKVLKTALEEKYVHTR